jgi:hypothetical protein
MKNKGIQLKIIFGTIFLSILGCEKEGPAGENGLNSLIKTTQEMVGANCANGGLKVQTGLDLNKNKILDDNEVNTTNYVCIEHQAPKVYSANLSQSGTNVPTLTVVRNELGLNITWIRTEQGKFAGTINNNLDLSKTIILCNNILTTCRFSKTNEIVIENTCGVNYWCDDFENLSIEIKVYK